MKRARAWLKEAWIRLKACKELIFADSYMVFTRAGKTTFTCAWVALDDPLIKEAFDFSGDAIEMEAKLAEIKERGESVANEAKDILRRASGEA